MKLFLTTLVLGVFLLRAVQAQTVNAPCVQIPATQPGGIASCQPVSSANPLPVYLPLGH